MPRKNDPPDCGRCNGTGRVQVEKPDRDPKGRVVWIKTTDNCSACGGTGKCS